MADPYFDTTSHKWTVETPSGQELEFDPHSHQWLPKLSDDDILQQQQAYGPSTTSEDPESNNKRKQPDDDHPKKPKKPKRDKPTRANTAVYVSNLPRSTTAAQLARVFGKAGVFLEDLATGEPRIKLYTWDHDSAPDPAQVGQFKGEALVVYLQEASVDLACRLFDETELELGSGQGVIKVQPARFDHPKPHASSSSSSTASTSRPNGPVASTDASNVTETDEERRQREAKAKRQGKKAAALRKQKLEDWSSSEDEASQQQSRKLKGVVVLEGMFTLDELEEDKTLLLDLKEDVRDECEALGVVTNVTLYDQEPRGIITVRFKDEISAQACILKMSGRFFAGRTIKAYPMTSSHKFVKSGKGGGGGGTEALASFDFSTVEPSGPPKGDQGGGNGDPSQPVTAGEEGGQGKGRAEELEAEKEKERLRKYAEWLENGGE
ncbi:hypothetical protein JCM10212_005328 [Sporobolomyces blumeae]